MLTELSIRNVAIIDQLQLSFGPGLNLLTGETGAGKSIIIDSLTLVCGGRASSELIRTGSDEAVVEALFDLSCLPSVRESLSASGFEAGNELLIKRCLNRSGRNRIFINGSLATLSQLSDAGRRLVTIHGQHESQLLLRPDYHLVLLDSFAGTDQSRRSFADAYEKWRQLEERLAHFDRQEREAVRRLDLLSFQADEIAAATLNIGEDELLEEQKCILSNAGRLSEITAGAYDALYGRDQTILGDLKRISASISEAVAFDPSLGPLSTVLEETYLQLEDTALQLRDYDSRIESDPGLLVAVEDRLDLIGRLKRKYAPTIEEIIELGKKLQDELDELRCRTFSREELEQELLLQRKSLELIGAELGQRRKSAAATLEKQLLEEIRQLAMKHAVVQIAFEELSEPRSSGYEKVEFLFSPNPGEMPRSLGKVASGGELSRLMLAFKQVLPEGEAPTLVFDEVDTGIGGAVAGVVGRKLKNVAASQQVFCVTHLPQVAAFADRHIMVDKKVSEGRTVTSAIDLDLAGRKEEIARMLAGEQITEAARGHAVELLANSR